MSNGVEVIVAGDKSKTAVHRHSVLRILPSNLYKPMTLAPSTLKNQMIMIAPSEENLGFPIKPNQFVTKTCLTTYTYLTTYLQDGTTTIESREKVISNIATEQQNYLKITPTSTSGVTLSRTPEFAIGVFHTTYTYLNTIVDGELPLVVSSKHIVTNTITGPEDYISFLQPSEEATPIQETNTYFSKITMTRTLHDTDIEKIVSTSNVLTQVVITESLPPKSTSVMTSYIALDATEDVPNENSRLHIYATKTYLTTFTYFTTVLKSEQYQTRSSTLVKSHKRVVENVITESIPNHMLSRGALEKFRDQLRIASTALITTLATLIGGQTLEITAMNMLGPQFHQQQTQTYPIDNDDKQSITHDDIVASESEIEPEFETIKDDDNVVVGDSEASDSEHNEHFTNVLDDQSEIANKTKINDKNGFQVPNLIGSLNLNGLTALGPVINAMAGLIQTNFGSPTRKNLTRLRPYTNEISSKNLLKNISSTLPTNQNDLSQLQQQQQQQHSPIYIPVRSSTNDLLNGKRSPSPASLHIAPPKPQRLRQHQHQHQHKWQMHTDEKSNRNNKLEITVGKPIYETPLLNGGIPISPGEVITANSDVIIGKQAGVRPRVPFHEQEHNSPNVIPLLSYQQNFIRPHQSSPAQPLPSAAAPSAPGYKNYHQSHPSIALPNRYQNQAPTNFIHTSPIPHSIYQQHQHQQHQYPQNVHRQPSLNNEILEIKRIPEVFSTDLPAFQVTKVQQQLGNTDKPMLVNIQPSQVANVVIPHGNTAPVLIIESTAELHKNGQYFDEPSPYPNTVIGIDSPTSQNNIIAGSDTYHGFGGSSSSSNGVGETSNHPIHINLDANVLSHNIDVHVPPITFKKENEYPHSTPIRGQHSQSVHKNGHFNVKIPYYDQEINVNLTPQHDHQYPSQQYQVHGMEPPPLDGGNSRPTTPTKTFHNKRPQYHYQPGGNNNNFGFNKNYLYGSRYPQLTSSQAIPLFVGDNSPVEHSQAPSITDEITDEHHDDDYENEEGEVIQESNSLPVIPGHYIDYPPTSTTSKPINYNIPPFLNMPSASAINELHHMEMKSTENAWTTTSTTSRSTTKSTSTPVSTTPARKSPTNTKPYFISIGEKFRPHNLPGPTTRPTLRPRLPSVPISSGSGFRKPDQGPPSSPDPSTNEIINGATDNFHNYGQVSLPIDRPQVVNDNKNGGHTITNISTTQTETPFNRNNYVQPLSNNSPVTNDLEKDSSEIFDYKESINPHNLGVINNLDDTSTTGSAKLPELSVNMRPPPPPSPVSAVQPITPTTEEVMGLSPPPLPSQVLFNTPLPSLNLRNPQRPGLVIPLRTSSTTPRTTTFSPTTLGDWTKPSTSPAPLTERATRPILRFSTRYRTPTTPMPRTKRPNSSKFNNSVTEKPISSEIIPTPSIKVPGENVTRTSPTPKPTVLHSSSGELFNEQQQIPDEILITGSEVSPTSDSSIDAVGHTETVTVTKPLSFSKRTRLVSKIILPTKYVTNTKTLTVTTTKTTVVESQGIPSTQTLILTITRTSTAVDTVTETEIHTLHQSSKYPTNTNIQLSPTIRLQNPVPTTVHHNPEKEPIPTDEIVNKITDFETTSNSSRSPSYPVRVHKIPPAFYPTPNNTRPHSAGNKTTDPDSIFVVMTDQKKAGTINMADTKKTPTQTTLNAIGVGGGGSDDTDSTLDDADYNNSPSFNLPERDEDPINGESNHVLLGGILIASPPKVSESSDCRPDCKASRNELCQRLDGHMRCVCRPGFARMFPDRPCKPTYTYKLSLPLHRFGKEMLAFNENLSSKDSDGFYYLAGLTHEALDRMVMQSDFRDIYHGVHVAGFDRTADGNGVVGEFYLQLSDDSDEQRLIDVFRKYLRSTNYSIGGTELYSARTGGTDDLKASDFNECLNTLFHDCSDSAHCFNLHGTYTCSCKEGFADLSENPVYPGRICSAEQIGCEKCYYHGTCYARELDSDSDQVLCQCFAWYAGASCQLNLKILLIALVAVGALLVLLLFFCLLVTCSKRRKAGVLQAPMSDINIILPKSGRGMRSGVGGRTGKATKLDKRAMIKDSSSEASHSSDTLPYVAKKNANKDAADKKLSVVSSLQHNAMAKLSEAEHRCSLLDQNDRSLTVMIPRAKYHPISHMENSGAQVATSCASEAKLLSYLDAGAKLSPSLTPPKKLSSGSTNHNSSNNKQLLASLTGGALVSAGFEVSATVGQDATATLDTKSHLIQKLSKMHNGSSALNSDGHSQYGGYKKQSGSENNDNPGGFLDPMDAWLDTMQQTELTVSEARSFDETTIQPQTKSLRSVYEKHSQLNNDEANTMAERDIGSTFLLPHTHLYKPDRGSDDVSGFDSF